MSSRVSVVGDSAGVPAATVTWWRSRSARIGWPNRSPASRPRKATGRPGRTTARVTLNGPPPARGSTWPAGSTFRSIRASPATVIIAASRSWTVLARLAARRRAGSRGGGGAAAVLCRSVESGRAGHDRHRLLHRVALRGDDARAAAQALDVDPVRDLEDVRHVVADQDDRQAPAAQPLDQGQHLAGLADAQGGGRLVQDDDLGAERGRARDRDGLALAAGQGLHLLGDVLDGADPEVFELIPGLGPHAAGVELAEDLAQRALVPDLPAEVEVAGDVQGGGDRAGLVHGLDAGQPGIDRALEHDLGPVH